MAATQKAASTGTASRSRGAQQDAVALLKADHKEVKALFKDYQGLVDDEAEADERQQLAERICGLLTVHATIEEELFYPQAREALGEDEDLVDEADVEHASAKDLIAQIQESSPEDQHYDAKVKVLGEYIEHHVKEEEGEMFAKLKKTDMDLEGIGEELADRKQELMEELGLADAAEDDGEDSEAEQAPQAKAPAKAAKKTASK